MRDTSPELVRACGIAKQYETNGSWVQALGATDLTVNQGETLALVGPSGCGKSTLLLLLAGLERPSSGSVRFRNEPLTRPHREIALVLQDYGLFPWKTVIQNVELGLRIRREAVNTALVDELMEDVEILDKKHAYPQQLSGGQKQRVALARALVLNPALLLLDEPFAAVDTLTRERLQDLLARAWRKRSFGMILVTHNIQEAVRLGQSIAVMTRGPGRIVTRVANPEACQDAYRATDDFFLTAREVREQLEHVT
jgi:NitT/TauT family transport system ATP-binding protein